MQKALKSQCKREQERRGVTTTILMEQSDLKLLEPNTRSKDHFDMLFCNFLRIILILTTEIYVWNGEPVAKKYYL